MSEREILSMLNGIEYSKEEQKSYKDHHVSAEKLTEMKELFQKSVLMEECRQKLTETLAEDEEIVYMMEGDNPNLRYAAMAVAMAMPYGFIPSDFGFNAILTLTNKKLYISMLGQTAEIGETDVFDFEDIVYMKTAVLNEYLDGGAEHLYIVAKNKAGEEKKYKIKGFSPQYKELFAKLAELYVLKESDYAIKDEEFTKVQTKKYGTSLGVYLASWFGIAVITIIIIYLRYW